MTSSTWLDGVNDLLASLGLAGQFEHAKVRETYARTIAACRKRKHVGVGGLSAHPKLAAEFVAMGARLVSTGTDIQTARRRDREGKASARDAGVRVMGSVGEPILGVLHTPPAFAVRAAPAIATCKFSDRPAAMRFAIRAVTHPARPE